MAWTSKDFDPQMLSEALLSAMKKTLSAIGNLPQSQDPTAEAVDINAYEPGRMRASGIDRLKTSCYLSVVNFYLNPSDKKAKGAMVLYVEVENASKFYKGLVLSFPDDEDDASMLVACGQFAQKVAEALRDELTSRGYGTLSLGKPRSSKSTLDAIEFSPDQKTKHEISFYYFKHKVLGLDLTLAPIPKK